MENTTAPSPTTSPPTSPHGDVGREIVSNKPRTHINMITSLQREKKRSPIPAGTLRFAKLIRRRKERHAHKKILAHGQWDDVPFVVAKMPYIH